MISRRNFLKSTGLISASLMIPRFLQAQAQLNYQGKKLIVVQLSGGNDGLNTFVPYRNDVYYRSRTHIGIAADKVLRMNDSQGMHPALEPLMPLYERGEMTLLNQVGYPNPDRSHFRSMDIWHTGSSSSEYWESGWLGRYLDTTCQQGTPAHKIIELEDTLSLAVKGEQYKALALKNPHQFYKMATDPYMTALDQSYQPTGHPERDYLYKTLNETLASAEYIHQKAKIYKSSLEYPRTPFGKRLKLIAELINSGVETSVFYVSLSGFDTHVRQQAQHEKLLTQYSEGISTLIKDLKQNNRMDETLIMTFSEFGRRVEENASGGTDHGKANNLFLIGTQLKQPGVYNATPSLSRLDEGDVPYRIDFRSVYANLLAKWLNTDALAILKKDFPVVSLV